ncbi:beta-glucosidase [Paenibacillus baekrokdamisoli]|uniref:beta-N-acetylhexosaminidase n=1 Tax=Paenibacillus baekrokdamisoli TaxID=1712516 RepID=A0A3G9J4G2_9BACL|nr:beta-N-acetylhexosaminidase [Paenibacillus baekrokdamisoli]MBB3072355.1 beta-N-acetylhexosaminidase [Paenibacillus baekrokdamisoli]BBH23225.1 beta-glucosidase [Paenibacillus baekrokdamisoli]
MKALSLEEKVGLMCVVGMPTKQVNEEVKETLASIHYGGLGLFPHNIENEIQLKKIIADLNHWAQTNHQAQEPFVIAIDEEGGSLANFTEFYPDVPGNRAIGLANDPELAYASGRLIGSQLHELGFMLDWAPVLDVNSNPLNPVIGIRSFGEDPKQVAAYGVSFIRGMRESGIVSTAKHFPGHGDVDADSHVELPTCDLTLEQLYEQALQPFFAAIEAGVGAIMTAHIVFPNIPESLELPASLSPFFITHLLREKLGFEGVICTDDIEMQAIKNNFDPAEIGVLAVLAGNDQIIMCHTRDFQEKVCLGILTAVQSGVISEERIDQSVKRILKLQNTMKQYRAEANVIPRSLWESHAAQIAEASIVVQRDPSQLLPLNYPKYILIVPELEQLTQADTTFDKQFKLETYLKDRGIQLETMYTSMNPTEAEHLEVERKIKQADAILQVTRNAHVFKNQLSIARLCANSKPHVCLVLRNPYDADELPEESSVVLICSSGDESMKAFARKFSGVAVS